MIEYLLENYLKLPNYLSNRDLDILCIVSSKYSQYITLEIWKERVIKQLNIKEIVFYPNHLNLIHNELHKTTISFNKNKYDIYRYLLRYNS